MGLLGTVQNRPVTQTTTQPTQPPSTPPAAETPVPPTPQLSPGSAANLANLRGASSSEIQRRVALGPISNPARSAAVEQVGAMQAAYTTAREEVNRLNGHLAQALENEPALRDPAVAERFRSSFLQTHAGAYERERTSARQLADTVRAAEPHLRSDGDLTQRMDAPALRDRMITAQALGTLAQSSEFEQAAQLAGRFSQGTPALLPSEVAQGIGERAAATGIQRDLAHGQSITDALTRASGVLGAAGLASRTPALSALGNALSVGENMQQFMRTGDPASISAMGFGALGAGGAAYAAATGAGGPLVIGIAGVAAAGRFMSEQIANRNDYVRSLEPALQQAFGMSHNDWRQMHRQTQQQTLEGFASASPENQRAYQMGGGSWLALVERNRDTLAATQQRLMSERLAARP